MSSIVLQNSHIQGNVQAPLSKSHFQRILALALLCEGTTEIQGICNSADSKAVIIIIQALGALVKVNANNMFVQGVGKQLKMPATLNFEESGLACRMFTPIVALSNQKITLTATGTLLKRPLKLWWDILPTLGVQMEEKEPFLPFYLQGPLQHQSQIDISESESSQYFTGLLFALGALGKETNLHVKNLKSTPYIALSLQVMEAFGVQVKEENFETFQIPAQNYKSPKNAIITENDWSGTAVLLTAAALAGKIQVTHIDHQSKQADSAIIAILKQVGAEISVHENSIILEKKALNAFYFDATHAPDLFPTLAALAIRCHGTSQIKGFSRLQTKESDRGAVILNILQKIGASHTLDDDILSIAFCENPNPISLWDCHHDHRIAMMGALISLHQKTPMQIKDPSVVHKSYAHFWQDWQKISK